MFLILGLGKCGSAVAKFMENKGIPFCVWDDAFENKPVITNIKTVIASPGVPFDHKVIKDVAHNGIEIISDIELFFRFFPETRAVGITGSNGKSTTCALIKHCVKDAIITGNNDTAIFEHISDTDKLFIIEFSSYALHWTENVPLLAAAITNIVPHHMDRHESFEQYADDKKKIFQHALHKVMTPDAQHELPDEPWFKRDHNITDSLIAAEILKSIGIEPDFAGFCGIEHRQEELGLIDGIYYVNDSKSTSPEATVAAITSFISHDIFLIAGGVIQDDDIDALQSVIKYIKKAYFIGTAAGRYFEFAKSNGCNAVVAHTLENAIEMAKNDAQKEDLILFSPACASKDQFKNFEHRGNVFKEIVFGMQKK